MKRSLVDLPAESLVNRRALVRVDYNVPLGPDGVVRDVTRIDATLPTLRHLLERGARPLLLSHLGRPRGKVDPKLSLAPVVPLLAERIGVPVRLVPSLDVAPMAVAQQERGGSGILLLENTRFLPGERRDDDALSRRFSALGDLFVNDAFGSLHRAHASVVGVTRHLRPAVAGLLVQEELEVLDRLRADPPRPFVVVFGGAKIGDKIELVRVFLERCDLALIGGAMGNTFLRAAGLEMGASLVETSALPLARELRERWPEKLRLPGDLMVRLAEDAAGERVRTLKSGQVPPGGAALDIGPVTRAEFAAAIKSARTLFWNGPMGWFEGEGFAAGTRAVAQAVAQATAEGAFTVVGGGDSARAIREAGLRDEVSHVSTGGGAALEYLASGTLPGLEALDEA